MTQEYVGPERRKYPRAKADAIAVVRHGQIERTFFVVDLSLGGARIVGPPMIQLGETVDFFLRLLGSPTLQLTGEVVRASPTKDRTVGSFGISFQALSAFQQETIWDAIHIPSHSGRTALIVDASAFSIALVEDLNLFGIHGISVATPLDAILWMEHASSMLDVAMIGDRIGQTKGDEFLDLLEAQYPGTLRIWVTSDVHNAATQHALLSGRAQAVLPAPWTAQELLRAVRHQE